DGIRVDLVTGVQTCALPISCRFEPVTALPVSPPVETEEYPLGVSDAGWKVAKLSEIPPRSELPGFSAEDYREAMAERAPHILERSEERRVGKEQRSREGTRP